MRTMIDLDDDALAAAAEQLGTATKRDTVNEALRFVADRRRRIDELLETPFSTGVGPDIAEPDVMQHARR